MESIEQERWARLLDAVRNVNGRPATEREAVSVAIGTLFILNFAGATVLGLGLLAPLERLLGLRWGGAAVAVLALAAIGLAATAFAFSAIAEQTPLFGFMEPGYDPPAILASRVAEAVTVVSLGAFGIVRFLARAPVERW